MRRLNVDGHAHLMTLGNWGVSDVGQVPGMTALLDQLSIVDLFKDYGTAGAPRGAWWGQASQLAQWAEQACADGSAPAT